MLRLDDLSGLRFALATCSMICAVLNHHTRVRSCHSLLQEFITQLRHVNQDYLSENAME